MGLVKTLLQKGYMVTIVAEEDRYSNIFKKIGCRFINLSINNSNKNPFQDLFLIIKYFIILFKTKPSIVLAFTIKPNLYCSFSARILSVPIVNNISGLGTSFITDQLTKIIVTFLYRGALKKSKCVFFQNQDDMKYFKNLDIVKNVKCRLIPGSGINVDHYTEYTRQKKIKENFTFIMIARVKVDKGVLDFIEAAKKVLEKYNSCKFILLGDIDKNNKTSISRSEVDNWVRDALIEYHDFTDDVRPFINASDCLVPPSYREGLPKSLLEASLMEKPIIASDTPGCRDVVDAPRTGLLCKVNDPTSLFISMCNILEMSPQDRKKMGVNGRKFVESKFHENIVIDAYLDEIGEL